MKVYLSGPMKGYADHNFPYFNLCARLLRDRKIEVVNPAEINPGPAPDEATCSVEDWKRYYNQCLRADLKALMDCDAIVLLNGWEKSNGANLELHVAHRVGMDVYFIGDLL